MVVFGWVWVQLQIGNGKGADVEGPVLESILAQPQDSPIGEIQGDFEQQKPLHTAH
jgi:hypothetical protein